MARYRTIDDLDVAGRRVLLRVDFNVPMRDGKVADATRIERALPTIKALTERGARVALLSHFGRPKAAPDPAYSLRPVAEKLSELLGAPVSFAEDCIGSAAQRVIGSLNEGEVAVLENTRFHAGEEANDRDFVAALAANGDLYVNDAFSAAHRAHASTEGLAHALPAAAGLAMGKELDYLASALSHPERPMLAVVGGAKVSSKFDLLMNLVGKADILVVGGGMANTFLHARGVSVGKSLCEPGLAEAARSIVAEAASKGCQLILPNDVVVAKKFEAGAPRRVAAVEEVAADEMILDLGPETVDRIVEKIEGAKTVVWNGPLGAFEIEPFDVATIEAARFVARRVKEGKLIAVAGGGDTVSALNHAGAADGFTYVSTAGGAFLEWLEGKALPGVKALEQA